MMCTQRSVIAGGQARTAVALTALVVVAACKTGGTPPPAVDPDASKPAYDTSVVADTPAVDNATRDFLEETKEIETQMKSGEPDWDDVRSRMKNLTQRWPKLGLAWYNLGLAEEKLGKSDAAEQAYRQAIGVTPELRHPYENLAGVLARRGDTRGAESLLREIAGKDAGAASARVAIGSATLARGDPDEAVRLVQEALARDPKNVEAYCVLVKAALEAKDHQRVRLIVSQGRKLSANHACFSFALAQILYSEKSTAEALAAYERAAEADPRLLEARFRIAEISMGFKDFKKAITSYDAVTKLDPKNAAAYVNMGVAFKGLARFADAEQAYLKAIEVGGQEVPEAHFNLGVLYLRNMSRNEDAKTALKKYLATGNAPSDDPAYAMLEEIDQMKAMEEEAKRQEEEAKRQEEIDKRAAEEEARRKAEEEKQEAELKKRMEESERRAKSAGEPGDPGKK